MDAPISTMESGSRRCPKFDSCAAPICPLDPDWGERRHLAGERICLWLRELVKPGGEAAARKALPAVLADEVVRALPAIEASNSDIRHKLKLAAHAGSKRGARYDRPN